jgi:hypothetical protein
MSVSGEVDFPAYMKIVHADWIANTDGDGNSPDKLLSSVTDIMNDALTNNPLSGLAAFPASPSLVSILNELTAFKTIVDSMSAITDWNSAINAAASNNVAINAYEAILDDQVETNALPKFNAGMRNINAVQTSAFTIGQSLIYAFKQRDVAKFQADVTMGGTKQIISMMNDRVNAGKALLSATIEAYRIKIVAEKEETDENIQLSERRAKWKLDVFQTGANLLASITGAAAALPGESRSSTTRTAIGGALSGAALGSMIGGMVGGENSNTIGAGLGAAAGLAASFF